METINNYESVTVPVTFLRAALACASTDKTQFHMNGVYVHRVEDSVRIVAIDGQRALVASADLGESAPEWLDQGVLIDRAGLNRAIGFLSSIKAEEVELGYLAGAGRVHVGDRDGDCLFRVKPVEATFPDYQAGLDMLDFSGREMADMESAVFRPAMLKGAADIAKVLDASHVRMHSAANDGPTLITFPDEPAIILVMMPMKQAERALPAPTAKLLEGPLKGTVAALRAHQTRAKNRLDKVRTQKDKAALEKVVEDYEMRITALLDQIKTQPLALPAPEPEAEPEIPVVVDEPTTGEIVEVEQPAEPLEVIVARSRGELQGKRRERAVTAFRKDINAALGEEAAAAAYGAVADDHDVDPWFSEGLSPEQAARAFIAFRKEQLFEAWIVEATGEPLPIDDETATLYREAFDAGTAPGALAAYIDGQKPQQLDEAAE